MVDSKKDAKLAKKLGESQAWCLWNSLKRLWVLCPTGRPIEDSHILVTRMGRMMVVLAH